MSESQENNQKPKTVTANLPDGTLKIQIDRDASLERLQSERDQYKEKMMQIAAIDFATQCQKYGLDPSNSTPDQLEAKKAEQSISHSAPRGGDTAPLSGQYDQHTFNNVDDETMPLSWMKFDSEAELYQKVAERSRKGDKEAKEIEAQLFKKLFKDGHSHEWEFCGKSYFNVLKSPVPILDTDPENVKAAKRKRNSLILNEKLAWKQIS